jgi:hypothetical protein
MILNFKERSPSTPPPLLVLLLCLFITIHIQILHLGHHACNIPYIIYYFKLIYNSFHFSFRVLLINYQYLTAGKKPHKNTSM